MAGHIRDGRRYLPELAATGSLELQDWVRDDLPDLLWPVLYLEHEGTRAAERFIRWQGALQRDLDGLIEPKALADGLDGRLTGLDRLVKEHPGAQGAIAKRTSEYELFPGAVSDVLATYPRRPAPWLIDRDERPATEDDLRFLSRALLGVLKDGHRESVIKCLWIWSMVQAKTFSTTNEVVELLQPYPNDARTRSQADTVVRASWGALKLVAIESESTRFDASAQWARVFWGVNSMTSRCIRLRDLESSSDDDPAIDEDPAVDGESSSNGEHLQQLAMDLLASYIQALETSPARLYDQERQEVHAGLVTRAGRELIAILGYRDMWCLEHSAQVLRTLVEVRIYLRWMATQEPSIYRRYQEFGSGKAKLYGRIIGELEDSEVAAAMAEAVEELDRLSHNDDVIDHRVVDTSDSFSGKSIRVMAEECGLLDLYRYVYYMASGVTHSEWWSVESHAMERCMNLLHRGHLIPSMSLNYGANVPLAQSWVDHLYSLIRMSLGILGTDEGAVADAFGWLDDDDDVSS